MSACATMLQHQSPKPDWHWPDFGSSLCGTMSDRERLGLPERYVAARFSAEMPTLIAHARAWSVEVLCARVASPLTSLAQRIACGNQLALLDDPRLCVDAPAMCELPAGLVQIGLAPEALEQVMHRFAGLGLNRTWIEKETPRHAVQLRRFRLARFPVTNLEFRTFLLDTGHPEIPSSWVFRQFPQERANHPVYTVSAQSADAYAQWLARRTGRGFRLPTEAEWEWAAAGPAGLEFPWGNDFDADLANTAETGLFSSTPVGVFMGGESHFGLSDMSGNVEEYVADAYAAYPGGPYISDHLVQLHGSYRIARGGSFARFRDLARTRRRHGQNPLSATYAMGFRLAETT